MHVSDPSSHSLPHRDRPVRNPATESGAAKEHRSIAARFFSWLENEPHLGERRRCPRVPEPPLRAYLGVFGSTQAIPVGDISATGFYLRTEDHWIPGTNMPLRLERTDKPGYAALHCVTVPARVIRTGSDGVGFTFVLRDLPATPQTPIAESEGGWLGARWADREYLEKLVSEFHAEHRRLSDNI